MNGGHLEAATEPGDPEVPNEDWYGWLPDHRALTVLDGVTTRGAVDITSGCAHGTPWYVQQLGNALLSHVAARPARLAGAVASAITQVTGLHSGTCDLSGIGAPSAALAVLRVTGDLLEWLVLADITIALELDDGTIGTITDDRVSESVAGVDPRSPDMGQQIRAAREAHRNRPGPGGYWVAAADPAAAEHAVTGTLPLAEVRRVLVTTDGAARFTDLFERRWREAFALGPLLTISAVRNLEWSDPHRTQWPRMKGSDDATAVLWVPPRT